MKLVKMSLLAATLIASTAYATEDTNSTYGGPSNFEVSGDAKLFYSTDDAGDGTTLGSGSQSGTETSGKLFDKNYAIGQAAAKLGATADLTENVSAGVSIIALSTLGLENQLVSGVWETTNGTDDSFWFDQVWLAGTVGKTTGKVGRMELDTPLVFSEKWSIATNTFEAALVVNQDLPDTTLYGAYVGGSNSGNILKRSVISAMDAQGSVNGSGDVTVGSATNFHQFYKGAYAIGGENNSWKPLKAQAWYYDATSVASAYWLEADLTLDMGLTLGAQFTGMSIKNGAMDSTLTSSSNTAFAAKVGYVMKDKFSISGAFSQTGNDKDNNFGAGMNLAAYGQSKLYTEAWWNYGYITRNDTMSYNVTATTSQKLTWAQLGIYFTQSASKDAFTGAQGVEDLKMTEVTAEAAKSFGPLDVGLYYIMTKADDLNQQKAVKKGDAYNTVQAYLTYNF